MASTYTYNDFRRAMQDNGLTGNFSDADLRLAQSNPDAGMSILKYKLDYRNASTDEMRALANAGAEGVRSSYGGYQGGADGGSFYLDPLSPGRFTATAAPTYTNNYAQDIEDLLGKQLNYGSYSYGQDAPKYANRYDQTIQDMLGQLVNREEFSYDPKSDELYSQYRKAYAREGQRATQDALGAAAAASGGIPSSYATTAASQAGDYYAAQLTDKIPELYQLAYNKYLNDFNMNLNSLSAVQGAEQSDYSKYLTELGQYNTDRSFDYGAWLDQYNMIGNNLQTASGLEQLDYTRYLNDVNQYNADRSFNYGQLLDEIDSQTRERQEAMNRALTAAEYGDYSLLRGMGVNTDNNATDWERQYNLARLAAEYGDYSGLQALGINPSTARATDVGGRIEDAVDNVPAKDAGRTLTEAAVQTLRTAYGGTVLTEAQWDEVRQANTWVTDEMLRAAGFTKMTAVQYPEGTIDGKSYEEYDAAAGNYMSVKNACDEMLKEGKSKKEILQALKDARASGVLNTDDYTNLYNKYRG